ncbi:asialoglycoprotein receptor 2 isoform X1 [Echinops telfairi]|uniref:Asialoglycoprotein receptor 2 isoform X1 n=1 Tax=Echinops telfairi TaxID=9371 RepID=A0ABM0J204_ECHTE|nr:asialoglycoprotein receptor 2 isoform X1 [Echinops telfairi]
MEKDFQDIQQLAPEENDHQLGKDEEPGLRGQNPQREDPFCKAMPPPKPFLQRLCSWPRLSVLTLGFNALLLVITCVTTSQSTQLQTELQLLKEAFSNFSSSVSGEIQSLTSHGSNVSDTVTLMATKLENHSRDLKSDHASVQLHLKHFPADLRILKCQAEYLLSNGTECCPVNWKEHEGNCYWFSQTGASWTAATLYCTLEDAHLVVVNSRDEQRFLQQHINPFDTWIGLSNVNNSWKWVDGTEYENGYMNWANAWSYPRQEPDPNRDEDCVEMKAGGSWNVDHCQGVHRWVCETKRTRTAEDPHHKSETRTPPS